MMQIWCAPSLPLPYSVVDKAVLFGHVSRPISVHTVMLTYFGPYRVIFYRPHSMVAQTVYLLCQQAP